MHYNDFKLVQKMQTRTINGAATRAKTSELARRAFAKWITRNGASDSAIEWLHDLVREKLWKADGSELAMARLSRLAQLCDA